MIFFIADWFLVFSQWCLLFTAYRFGPRGVPNSFIHRLCSSPSKKRLTDRRAASAPLPGTSTLISTPPGISPSSMTSRKYEWNGKQHRGELHHHVVLVASENNLEMARRAHANYARWISVAPPARAMQCENAGTWEIGIVDIKHQLVIALH